jgi:hypothetical protein
MISQANQREVENNNRPIRERKTRARQLERERKTRSLPVREKGRREPGLRERGNANNMPM